MTSALLSYLPMLLLTLAIEVAVVAALTRPPERRAALQVCLALNLFTHPFATLLFWRWSMDLFVLEGLVLLCEWLGYLQLLGRAPLGALRLALSANVFSWLVAIAIWMWRTI